MQSNIKKSTKEIANEKSERIMQGIAAWCAFYRSNPHRFVEDYLNIKLKLFQKILIYMMMHCNCFMYIASRGLGKVKKNLFFQFSFLVLLGRKGQ